MKKKCLMRIKSTKSTKNVFASNSYSRTRQMPRSPLRQHPLTMEERYQSTVAAAGGDDNGRRHHDEGNDIMKYIPRIPRKMWSCEFIDQISIFDIVEVTIEFFSCLKTKKHIVATTGCPCKFGIC